jgi:hypothetical protein
VQDNYIIVGDIHGRFDLLTQILETISKRDDLNGYRKVFVGDMIDRGPDSFNVVDTIKKLTEAESAIALLGNHEDMMLRYVERGVHHAFDIWHENGGKRTMDSYEKSMKLYGHGNFFRAVARSGHLKWLRGLLPYHETERVWISHAPIPAREYRRVDDFRRDLHTLIWSQYHDYCIEEDKFLDDLGKTAVCGHVHRLLEDGNMNARIYKNGIYIDSGCGCAFNAPLTAVVLTDGKYNETIQAWPPLVKTRTISNEDKRAIWS